MELKVIAKIRTDFPAKFGIPRQSGIVGGLEGTVVFEPEYRNPDALRGIDGFSHLWLIWNFSENERDGWSPTVRPPRLGGNVRMGVFATRSPFRPNPIGLSCVRLAGVETTEKYGDVLHVLGADLMDGTPIYDIKPYIPFVDCIQNAVGGFANEPAGVLEVDFAPRLLDLIPESKRAALCEILAQDPRPHYQNDPSRVYGFMFAGFEVSFSFSESTVHVVSVSPSA